MRALILLAAFVGVPLLEIYVLIQVGQAIGVWQTIFLLLAMSVLGTWLVKREGKRAWRALREATQQGRLPDREVIDAGLVLVGGTLMLTPGFVTDIFGFLFVLPFTRAPFRKLARWAIGRQALRHGARLRAAGFAPGGGSPGGGSVIVGEIIDDDPRKTS